MQDLLPIHELGSARHEVANSHSILTDQCQFTTKYSSTKPYKAWTWKAVVTQVWIWNFWPQILNLLGNYCRIINRSHQLGKVIFSENVAEIEILLQQMPLKEFQISDSRSGIVLKFWPRRYIDHPDRWRSYFPEMWLKYYNRCHWWNLKFLTSDPGSPKKLG